MATRRKFVSEASAEALLRFGPELSTLKALMAESGAGYRQKVHAAQAGASAIEASSARATEQLKGIYGNDPIAGIPGLSRVQAIGDMIGRGVAAQESAAGARRTALQELAADRAKINLRRGDIAQEIGAFQTSTVGRLGREAAQRDLSNRISLRSTRQSERSSVRSSGYDPDTGLAIPGGKADPNKPRKRKLASPAQNQAAADHIGHALGALQGLDPDRERSNRPHVASLLVTGAKAQPLYAVDPATKKRTQRLGRGGVPLATPEIPRIPQPFASIAADVFYDGHVSRANADRLHKLGYSLRDLKLPTYGQYKRTQRRPTAREIGAIADALSHAVGL